MIFHVASDCVKLGFSLKEIPLIEDDSEQSKLTAL
jgi:hypothetical protein